MRRTLFLALPLLFGASCTVHTYRYRVADDGIGYAYYGHHPVTISFGGGWCFIDGYHTHEYEPDESYYSYSGSYYTYVGPTVIWYYDYHPIPSGGHCYIRGRHSHDYGPGHHLGSYYWDTGRNVYVYNEPYHPASGARAPPSHSSSWSPPPISSHRPPAGEGSYNVVPKSPPSGQGHGDFPPGGTAQNPPPGHGGAPPGHGGTPPGQGHIVPPGHLGRGELVPGGSAQNPPPGHGGTPPRHGGILPGQGPIEPPRAFEPPGGFNHPGHFRPVEPRNPPGHGAFPGQPEVRPPPSGSTPPGHRPPILDRTPPEMPYKVELKPVPQPHREVPPTGGGSFGRPIEPQRGLPPQALPQRGPVQGSPLPPGSIPPSRGRPMLPPGAPR